MNVATSPLISIALCTFDGATYLREQLDSLLGQTYSNLEIVVVDDESHDATVSILREYEQRDKRIRIYENTTNLGFRKNFERALSLCSGAFIAPCDQDDIWLPKKIEELHAAIDEHSVAYCDSEIVDSQGESQNYSMSSLYNMISTHDPLNLVGGNCVSGHAMLFRRELLDRALPIPEFFYYDWWLAAVGASDKGVIYCNLKLVRYRLHDRNVTNSLRVRPRHPPRGRRSIRLREFRMRLEQLARLPGPSENLIRELLWRSTAREHQLFSFGLSKLMYRYWPQIFAVRRSRASIFSPLRYAVGLRLKRLLNPAAYRTEDSVRR
jgi:glycosyltransferase involved in cell wall biosynthesis